MTPGWLISGPTRVMGICNVTPDSFSDGGDHLDPEAAIEHGLRLHREGARLVDVGGESTRPGIARTEADEEQRRVLPVVEALVAEGVVVSVDTMRAETATLCVRRGAALINDVSGGLADDRMLPAVAELGVSYVAMHWRAHSRSMADAAHYRDVTEEVRGELADRIGAARAAGVEPDRLILDPGIGFAKTAEHNWTLLRDLPRLAELGYPLLIGVSRKRFLGDLLGGRPAKERDDASVALTTWLASQRVWAVRTHSVRAHCDAIAVAECLR